MTADEDTARTYHASQAAQVSDLINLKFAVKTFGTETKRYLRAMEPDGPSTDGGRKARQALMMMTKDEMARGGGVVCGFIDVSSFVAEIRTYAVVSSHFNQRYSRPFDVSKGEYDRMHEQLDAFLKTQGFMTRVATTPRRPESHGGAPIQSKEKSAPLVEQPRRIALLPLLGAFAGGFLLCYLLVRLGVL
jgi:hypothetical protein